MWGFRDEGRRTGWFDVYLLRKLEDKCHLWITDSPSCCERGGGALRRLVVNVSGRGYSPARETLIAFLPSWAGWNVSGDTFSLLSSLTPLTLPITPRPEALTHMIQLTQEELSTVRTRLHQQTPINMNTASLLSPCHGFSAAGGGGAYFDTSHFLFHESHLRALGWTEVMNEWANDPLKTGQRVERRFQRGKTFPSLLQWQITLSHYAESGSLNAAAEVHRSGFSLWVNTVIQTVFSANSSHLHLYFL